ncbi:hypothetical protein Air01nite_27700 [Asanoa iriomotensis]|uniref:Uncharacterized protein n=2 Tax=Asanoa iriomotensis TaxID=234613 RepID=A0ABQ4C1M0_9ACTN|nr:hypothetical protein Air01nite_27700 [Asanoa iriomotensis]
MYVVFDAVVVDPPSKGGDARKLDRGRLLPAPRARDRTEMESIGYADLDWASPAELELGQTVRTRSIELLCPKCRRNPQLAAERAVDLWHGLELLEVNVLDISSLPV